MLVVASEDVVGERARETRDAVGGAGVRGIGDAGGDPVRQGPRVEVDEVGDALVEEGTVVAREQHRAGPRQEHRCEQLRATIVEVVGRLVEQQRLRTADEHPRQGEAGELAAGDLVHRRVTRDRADAEAVDEFVDRVLDVPRVGSLRRGEGRVEFGCGERVLGVSRETLARDLDRSRQSVDRLGGVVEHVLRRQRQGERRLLMMQTDAAGRGDAARIRALEAGDEAQKRRLARAVLADEGGAFAPRDAEGDVRQDATVGVALRHAVDAQVAAGRAAGRGQGR